MYVIISGAFSCQALAGLIIRLSCCDVTVSQPPCKLIKNYSCIHAIWHRLLIHVTLITYQTTSVPRKMWFMLIFGRASTFLTIEDVMHVASEWRWGCHCACSWWVFSPSRGRCCWSALSFPPSYRLTLPERRRTCRRHIHWRMSTTVQLLRIQCM